MDEPFAVDGLVLKCLTESQAEVDIGDLPHGLGVDLSTQMTDVTNVGTGDITHEIAIDIVEVVGAGTLLLLKDLNFHFLNFFC